MFGHEVFDRVVSVIQCVKNNEPRRVGSIEGEEAQTVVGG